MCVLYSHEIASMMSTLRQFNHVYIDEGQFFSDIGVCARELAKEGIHVTIALLNCSHDGKPWKCMEEIGPCENILLLKAGCEKCKANTAIYSHKLTGVEDLMDTASEYEPLCRKCYNKKITTSFHRT
jgi:thymidine kinase